MGEEGPEEAHLLQGLGAFLARIPQDLGGLEEQVRL